MRSVVVDRTRSFQSISSAETFTSNTCHTKKKPSSVRDLFTSFFSLCVYLISQVSNLGPVDTEECKCKTKRRLFQQMNCIALSHRKVADIRENINSHTRSLSVNVNVPKTNVEVNISLVACLSHLGDLHPKIFPKLWEVAGTYNWYFIILWMQDTQIL